MGGVAVSMAASQRKKWPVVAAEFFLLQLQNYNQQRPDVGGLPHVDIETETIRPQPRTPNRNNVVADAWRHEPIERTQRGSAIWS